MEIDDGLVGLCVEGRLCIGQVVVFGDDLVFDGNLLVVGILYWQYVDIGCVGLSKQMKFEIIGFIEQCF